MKCFDCVGKKVENPATAEYILVDYHAAVPLCKNCLDDILYMEGENNVDYYHIELDLTGVIRRINEIIKYHQEMIGRYSERYFTAKKIADDCHKRNVKIAPEALQKALKW